MERHRTGVVGQAGWVTADGERERLAETFNRAAELYQRSRPEYPSELPTGVYVTAAWIFAKDRPGIERSGAMLAILDGPSVDDGTACEIGVFHALMQSDPSKKGIVGLFTDIRGMRGESMGVNLFVQGAIEDVGRIVASIEEARDVLRAWG